MLKEFKHLIANKRQNEKRNSLRPDSVFDCKIWALEQLVGIIFFPQNHKSSTGSRVGGIECTIYFLSTSYGTDSLQKLFMFMPVFYIDKQQQSTNNFSSVGWFALQIDMARLHAFIVFASENRSTLTQFTLCCYLSGGKNSLAFWDRLHFTCINDKNHLQFCHWVTWIQHFHRYGYSSTRDLLCE